jgi:DNA-binding NarL/FixJ family response regulator
MSSWIGDGRSEDARLDVEAAPCLLPTRARRIRVLVADPQQLFVETLLVTLETDERFEAVGYALEGAELLKLAAAYQPDVVLVSVELPEIDGVAAMEHVLLLCPDSRVVLVTAVRSEREEARALAAGAAGVISKRSGVDELFDAIAAAMTRRETTNLARQVGWLFRR